MSIWSADNHIRQPWFDYRIKKRKRSCRERTFSGSSDESEAGEGQPAKRARCSALEQGLADLSLLPSPSGKGGGAEQGPMIVEIPRGAAKVGGMGGRAVLPSSIEEPEQDIPEVEMKTSSWYEIDAHRIVITDLDLFEAEDEDVGGSGLTVNADLLRQLKDQPPLIPRELLRKSSAENQALVLFRPLPIPDEVLEQKARDVESMEVEF